MSDSFSLTDEERRRFLLWLERQAESNRLLIQQLEKLPDGKIVSCGLKQDLAGFLIVANVLQSSESMTLKASDK